MIPLPALLHRRTRQVFALFFEDASHFQHNSSANRILLLPTHIKASSKIKSDKKEYQISRPDEKHFYYLIWFFHQSKKFDTLSKDDHLQIQPPIHPSTPD